jgi:hypothetical protein
MRFLSQRVPGYFVYYNTHFVATRAGQRTRNLAGLYLINSMHQNYIGEVRSRVSDRTFHETRQHNITFTKACFGQYPEVDESSP